MVYKHKKNREDKYRLKAKLVLEDGSVFEGNSFGYEKSTSGEVVFCTGMVGYPESLTDPSYYGQILVLTNPIIGNYGVPDFVDQDIQFKYFESSNIQVRALVIDDYSDYYSHYTAKESLGNWLKSHKIPGICNVDTRILTTILRERGTMLGRLLIDEDVEFFDPNKYNLVKEVSCNEVKIMGKGKKRIAVLDLGCKNGILRELLKRGVEVLRLPWNADIKNFDFDGIVISNGPGDPKMCGDVIENVKGILNDSRPIMGICLGHQILALSVGADTYKMKYGHRGQNQPVVDLKEDKCYITSQNHGFAVKDSTLPSDWIPWFSNLNDKTSEGMMHESGKFFSVQFHPEASPGPIDTSYLFDKFLAVLQ
ncbi:MAG: glutamine-hydrolyzing carbamoyl-phosphate synthase small subunit [Candidatus Marinimicrobia bacterium]|nr:glutamine-hydrolyzing carbamoyl-phosphate synthase small subunit [Candidatus Neomarinimicrobiota bacterium]